MVVSFTNLLYVHYLRLSPTHSKASFFKSFKPLDTSSKMVRIIAIYQCTGFGTESINIICRYIRSGWQSRYLNYTPVTLMSMLDLSAGKLPIHNAVSFASQCHAH